MKWFAIFLVSFTGILFSCNKKIEYPTDSYHISQKYFDTTSGLSMFGQFLLIDADMYVTYPSGKKVKYKHFSKDKPISSIRFEGPLYDIESIVQNVTTYSFYPPDPYDGVPTFILNGDTTKPYGLSLLTHYTSIIEYPTPPFNQLMGGSKIEFAGGTIDKANKIADILIRNVYRATINGYPDCTYFSVLRFKKIKEW